MKTKYIVRLSQLRLLLGIICAVFLGAKSASAFSGPGDIIGKTMVGYQGWFSGLNDGSPIGNWNHYCNSGTPSANNVGIKCWPDMRDYTTSYHTAFANLGNGQPANVFSTYDQQTVTAQFQSMQQAGIDGAALQRFASWTTPGSTRKAQDDAIATRVKTAAEATGRKFFIMYDCSGTGPITNDWNTTIVNALSLTSSSAYAKQNGKPVVCLWDVGNTTMSTASWIATINWFKSQGCYVIGGVLHTWTGETGGSNGPVYNACNCIQPWVVGAVYSIATADSFYTGHIIPDLAYCSAHGLDYQVAILPGDNSARQRLHGNLMWEEFYNAVRAGVPAFYISMFDEYNEGNQIAKTAENSSMIPTDAQGGLALGLDEDGTAVSSDYYLRETGDGEKMLKGQIALTSTRPTPFFPPSGPANGTYKLIVRHSGLALDVSHQSTTNGSPTEQWTYNGGNNQRWTVTSLGGNTYKIVGVQSGRTLEVAGASTANGAIVDIFDSNNGANQKWTITPTDSGYYSVINVNSGKAMEVFGGVGATQPGAIVDQWSGTQFNQQWSFQAP